MFVMMKNINNITKMDIFVSVGGIICMILLWTLMGICMYIYICACVCVCVCVIFILDLYYIVGNDAHIKKSFVFHIFLVPKK